MCAACGLGGPTTLQNTGIPGFSCFFELKIPKTAKMEIRGITSYSRGASGEHLYFLTPLTLRCGLWHPLCCGAWLVRQPRPLPRWFPRCRVPCLQGTSRGGEHPGSIRASIAQQHQKQQNTGNLICNFQVLIFGI